MDLQKTVFFTLLPCWFHRGLDLQSPHALFSDGWLLAEHSSGKGKVLLVLCWEYCRAKRHFADSRLGSG